MKFVFIRGSISTRPAMVLIVNVGKAADTAGAQTRPNKWQMYTDGAFILISRNNVQKWAQSNVIKFLNP